MFGTFLLVACTALLVYVFVRAATVPVIRRHAPGWLLAGVAGLLWLALLGGQLLRHRSTGPVGAAVGQALLDWMATLFLLATAMLAVDLVTGFGLLLRRHAPALRGWALVAGLVLAGAALVQGVRPPEVTSYEVTLKDLPPGLDGTVVVVLSDLHLGAHLGADWLAARADQVRALHPDLVLLLGDVVEGLGTPDPGLVPGLSALAAPLGAWAVTGNHESHGPGAGGLLAAAGVRLLRDESATARPGLVLVGVDDRTARHDGPEGDAAVTRLLAWRPPGAVLYLSHRPVHAGAAAAAGASLMLSGHTHGGQIWPFSLLVRAEYPLLAGLYRVDGMPVVVSRGAGTWGPRMRLFRRGEIVRLVLHTEAGTTTGPGPRPRTRPSAPDEVQRAATP